jgi:hypothetical protein
MFLEFHSIFGLWIPFVHAKIAIHSGAATDSAYFCFVHAKIAVHWRATTHSVCAFVLLHVVTNALKPFAFVQLGEKSRVI